MCVCVCVCVVASSHTVSMATTSITIPSSEHQNTADAHASSVEPRAPECRTRHSVLGGPWAGPHARRSRDLRPGVLSPAASLFGSPSPSTSPPPPSLSRTGGGWGAADGRSRDPNDDDRRRRRRRRPTLGAPPELRDCRVRGRQCAGHLTLLHLPGRVYLYCGGDNSDGAVGTFYEGAITKGYSTDGADTAVQADIVAAGYGKT